MGNLFPSNANLTLFSSRFYLSGNKFNFAQSGNTPEYFFTETYGCIAINNDKQSQTFSFVSINIEELCIAKVNVRFFLILGSFGVNQVTNC